MSFERLAYLVKKTESPLSLQDFHSRINIVFHNHEAMHYDELHKDMWESLQEQFDLLVLDLLPGYKPNHQLKLLDVGCGTGLSTEKLLNTQLGNFIESIVLLDTSPKMLEQAKKRAVNWNKQFELVNATCDTLTEKFDIIIVCSVLHHIPDLDAFLNKIDNLLNPNGLLIHLQDPNGDYAQDPEFKSREHQLRHLQKFKKPIRFIDLLPKAIKHKINLFLGRKNYIDLINDELFREKTIRHRLTADEIWSVTDIHVESEHNEYAGGISFTYLKNKLEDFTLLSHRTYGFYGALKHDLPPDLQINESKWIAENKLNGRNLGCVWLKN
jgi:2-polyprenyl-3-methyl-5-hydroxy-6-metoxy-1,4-benzoquinol methylase